MTPSNTMPDGWRIRTSWLGKVILQRRYRKAADYPGNWQELWRDAKSTDLVDFFTTMTQQTPR